MLFPVRDSVPSRVTPLMNIAIVVACGVVFGYQLVLGADVAELFSHVAFIPARLFDSVPPYLLSAPDYGIVGNLGTVVASMFMHGGWLHIIGNMWFLCVFGDNVESALGHGRYLLFYLAGGAFASLIHGIAQWTSTVPTVGASGAIAAVLGAYLVWFPQSRVQTLVFLGFFITMAELPAVVFLGFWFILQFFLGTVSLASTSAGGVAWFAHIGGFIFGVWVAWWMKRSRRVRPARSDYRLWYRF
jgi:membrane associated rhomboid family serine protease